MNLPKSRRYGAVVGVKSDKVERYKELHTATWPEVLAIIRDGNMTNYSIFLRKLPDGHYYLFSYFEYIGEDYDADMARIAENPVTKRWWAECVPCLEILPDASPGEIWSPLEEVFHLA